MGLMDWQAAARALVPAELVYAAFNARRTTDGDEAAVQCAPADAVPWVCDPARPHSSYYHRAVAREIAALEDLELSPEAEQAAAWELWPDSVGASTSAFLQGLGYRPAYALCYLAVQPAALAPQPATAQVELLRPDQADLFLDLLQQHEGLQLSAEKRARKRHFYATDEFQVFLSRDNAGQPCAWATLHVAGGAGFLGNSFTLSAHRRQGHHRALLQARLQRARELGLAWAFTDVAHGSPSHLGCEQAGLRTLTVNTIWHS
ncbi:MAG TPA: GNAT family N-acetyltransferase [Ideonella sp.]|uniref:GNAT family N-acetyltransferase n=1 Tax=Ideonella sp. TaxID=1929293 RepID=UPI002C7762FF|nr:GNAT family N-acetyltransferase [Ideonella sp.]HSI48652.1 GNAT family N-acetyltransferase [Ideonella sp.]